MSVPDESHLPKKFDIDQATKTLNLEENLPRGMCERSQVATNSHPELHVKQ